MRGGGGGGGGGGGREVESADCPDVVGGGGGGEDVGMWSGDRDRFVGLEGGGGGGGGGGGDLALNSCSVFGFECNLALNSKISLLRLEICSSFSVKQSMMRFAMSCASTSAAFAPSRNSSLELNLV